MLPRVEPKILAANPKFDALYRDLCINKLNVDGTTKVDAKTQKERDAFGEDLRKARVSAAKHSLIKCYLHVLAYTGHELPTELQELVAIIAAALHAQLSKEDTGLLRDDVDKFKDNVMLVALVVSKAAIEDLTALARALSPGEDVHWRDIPGRIERIKEDIATSEARLGTLRLEVAQEATNVHAIYRTAMETSIRILEQTIHGSMSRSTKAKADYLATVAEGMSRKLRLQQDQLINQTNSPEMQEALKAKSDDLDRESMALKRKMREAEEKLAEYREARALEGMATEYAEILRETQSVQADIDKLEGQST